MSLIQPIQGSDCLIPGYHDPMKTLSATEVGRNLSAVLDAVSRGESVEVVRGGVHVATIVPPVRPNGQQIIDFFRGLEPDPEWGDATEEAVATTNTPEEVRDPWADA